MFQCFGGSSWKKTGQVPDILHMSQPLTNEVRKTSNEYHGVANNLWTLNVKNLRGFVAKDCEIQSKIEAEYLFRK